MREEKTDMTAQSTKGKVFGYLPDDMPPWWELIILGFQHVLTMFPATVFCALSSPHCMNWPRLVEQKTMRPSGR